MNLQEKKELYEKIDVLRVKTFLGYAEDKLNDDGRYDIDEKGNLIIIKNGYIIRKIHFSDIVEVFKIYGQPFIHPKYAINEKTNAKYKMFEYCVLKLVEFKNTGEAEQYIKGNYDPEEYYKNLNIDFSDIEQYKIDIGSNN